MILVGKIKQEEISQVKGWGQKRTIRNDGWRQHSFKQKGGKNFLGETQSNTGNGLTGGNGKTPGRLVSKEKMMNSQQGGGNRKKR